MTTGDPTMDYIMALGDLAERLSIVAVLLLVAVAFLKRWVVPKQTADDMVKPYQDQVNKLTNGMDGKLTEVVEASHDTTEAVRALTASLERQTTEAVNSRIAMIDKVGQLMTTLAAHGADRPASASPRRRRRAKA